MPNEGRKSNSVDNGECSEGSSFLAEALLNFVVDPTAKTPSAFVRGNEIVEVTSEVLRHLQVIARDGGATSRLCFHKAVGSQSNFMLIAYAKDVESRVKRHLSRNKTYVLVRGNLNIETYSEDAQLMEVFELSLEATTILFVPAGTFHRTYAVSGDTLVAEYLDGAFLGESADREYLT